MNPTTLLARLALYAALAAAIAAGGWYGGLKWERAAWDHQKALDAATALEAQRTVIKNIAAQTERAAAAEALNASLQTGYNALADHLADSVRRYEAARRSPVHPAVADTGGSPGGPAPGPGDPGTDELARLTRAATQACLDTYRELRDVWAAEPPKP